MKRLVSLLLVLAFMVSMISGCGQSINKVTSAASSQAASSNSTADKKVTLNLIGWGPIDQKIFDGFTAKNPNISVSFQQITDAAQYSQILRTRLAGGDDLDLMGIRPEDLKDFIKQGYLTDLKAQGFIKNFMETALKDITVDGKIYGIPMGQFAEAVWYNKDLFKKLNLQIPTDYDQFVALCDTIKKSNTAAPIVCNVKDGWAAFELALGPFQAIVEKDPDIFTKLDSGAAKYTDPQFIVALNAYENIVKKGYVLEGSAGLDWQGAQQQWAQQKAAMYITGSWNCGSIRDAKVPFEVGVFAMPQNAPGGAPAAALIPGLWYSANAKGKNVDASIKFLEYFGDLNGGASIYFTTNGYLPSVKGATVEDPLVKLWLPLMEGPGYPSFRVKLQAGPSAALFTALTEMFTGSKTAEQAAKDLQAAQDKVIIK